MSEEVERPRGCSMVGLLTLCLSSFVGLGSILGVQWNMGKGDGGNQGERKPEFGVNSSLFVSFSWNSASFSTKSPVPRETSQPQTRTTGHLPGVTEVHSGQGPQRQSHPTPSYIRGNRGPVGSMSSTAWGSGLFNKGWIDLLSCHVGKIIRDY